MNKVLTLLAFALLVNSCTTDFETINENPNSPENIDPQFLLSNVISEAADLNTYDQGFRLANYLTQFAASVEFERIDRYEMGTNATYWNQLYSLLADIQSMQTVEATNEAYIAVGDILKCHIFSQLTDMWGDVPYTEALMASEGNTTPKYDTQEAIYTDPEIGILAVLNRSADVLATTTARISSDVLFDGDLSKWVRFANALQVRYTLRISDKITDFSALQGLVDSDALMQGNADNAVLPYLAAAPNQWPMSQASQGLYQEHRMTEQVARVFSESQDPRVAVLYKPTEASVIAGAAAYRGLQNGLSRETISSRGINLQDISLFGAVYRDQADGVDAQFMQYSEQQFALAEAALKGLITADAETLYHEGIAAHFDYLGVDLPADFYTRPSVALTPADGLEKIMTQKWISLISNGHEAWFNVRRTGFPQLTPGPDNLNGDRYPVRYLYPESEQAVNAVNYSEAVDRMGGDNINSKGWWEQ